MSDKWCYLTTLKNYMERNAKFIGENFENSCRNSIRAAAKFGRKFAHKFADTFVPLSGLQDEACSAMSSDCH